jgi:glycosyltransferase involved in cell wall biosynthesis
VTPRISIVIANYNYARYLGAAIASALAQTWPDTECIVVDDGSTDDSLAVARTFPGITLIEKRNGGQVSAHLAALPHITGDLVLFLDSDDTLLPDACAAVAAAYDPQATLYQAALDIVDRDGRVIGRYPDAPLLADGHVAALTAHGFFPSSPTSGNAFATSHVRRMLDTVGEDRRWFVDGYLIYSAPFFGKIVLLDATLGRYLVHGDNVSLSAGVNRRSAEKSLRNALWQRTAIPNALRLLGREAGRASDYLTAWQLRHLLILRRCYGVADIAPELSDGAVARRAITRFLRYPGISMAQRAKNAALMLALLLGDRRAGARIVPPVPQTSPC